MRSIRGCMWQREVVLCISMLYEVNKGVHVAERGVVVYKHVV